MAEHGGARGLGVCRGQQHEGASKTRSVVLLEEPVASG